jgi:hypothetical protein
MSQIYLSDLNDRMQQDFLRDIEKNRPELIKELDDGDIAIGEYYNNADEYETV